MHKLNGHLVLLQKIFIEHLFSYFLTSLFTLALFHHMKCNIQSSSIRLVPGCVTSPPTAMGSQGAGSGNIGQAFSRVSAVRWHSIVTTSLFYCMVMGEMLAVDPLVGNSSKGSSSKAMQSGKSPCSDSTRSRMMLSSATI